MTTSTMAAAATGNPIRLQIDLPAVQFVPVMGQEKFAESVGVTEATVRNWLERGYLPSVKIGKRRLVNVAAITADALAKLQQELTNVNHSLH